MEQMEAFGRLVRCECYREPHRELHWFGLTDRGQSGGKSSHRSPPRSAVSSPGAFELGCLRSSCKGRSLRRAQANTIAKAPSHRTFVRPNIRCSPPNPGLAVEPAVTT